VEVEAGIEEAATAVAAVSAVVGEGSAASAGAVPVVAGPAVDGKK
jgi:hypothetical protein